MLPEWMLGCKGSLRRLGRLGWFRRAQPAVSDDIGEVRMFADRQLGQRTPGGSEGGNRAVRLVRRIAERDSQEPFESPVDSEAGPGRDEKPVTARGDRQLRTDRNADIHPGRQA